MPPCEIASIWVLSGLEIGASLHQLSEDAPRWPPFSKVYRSELRSKKRRLEGKGVGDHPRTFSCVLAMRKNLVLDSLRPLSRLLPPWVTNRLQP